MRGGWAPPKIDTPALFGQPATPALFGQPAMPALFGQPAT